MQLAFRIWLIRIMTVLFCSFFRQASVSTSRSELLSLMSSSICDSLSFLCMSVDLRLGSYCQHKISDHWFCIIFMCKNVFCCFFICQLFVARIWGTSLEKSHHLALENPMEQSTSWETNRFSASQAIPHILWNPNIHYRIHKWPHRFLSWASLAVENPT